MYVGTGRYLGASDVNDQSQQSLYAIVDQMNATGIGNARSETTCPLVKQTLTIINSNTRSTSTLPVDFASKCGWFLDFNPANATPGERVNVDPKLQLGMLAVATNIPEQSVCTVGGTSFLYFLDYQSGTFAPTAAGQVAGQRGGQLHRGGHQHLPAAGRPHGDDGDDVGRQAPGVRRSAPAEPRERRQARDVEGTAELSARTISGARPPAGRFFSW